jgi:P-type Ca2+ transporter type 2C
MLLEAGDMVPADLRILEAWNLEVNEAMLTGESLPARKESTVLPEATPLADRSNLLFMGTVVTRGRTLAVVLATGADTQIGGLQSLLNQEEEAPTPLQQRVDSIGKRFVTGALIAGAVVGIAGFLRGMPPLELLVSTVTLAASAIPEGLPLTITIALTAGVMRMAKRKAVVRKLASLESLGRVTVICSDKTGTLTRNEMTVKEIVTLDDRLHVTGEGYEPDGKFLAAGDCEVAPDALSEDVRRLMMIGLLCNNSRLEQQNGGLESIGDPTETALLTAAAKAGLSTGMWTRHREIPFDSNTGSMSVVCQESEEKPNCLLLTKGSPEAILKKCTHYQQGGNVHPLTDKVREQIHAENLHMAEQALRVLGYAYRELCEDEDVHQAKDDGLIYVGLTGMIDPPKEDVAASIMEARRLGLKPVMITGDHPVTAKAIGLQLGIYHEGDRVLTGDELERLSPEELASLVKTTSVFARVSPEHKLRIVEAYQKGGEIVAMTGDGVNDAPAVRKADVGIAMGAKGTDLTKNTAGIVLMEDHFQAIVEGIKEGRTIIGNIRKAIGCLLTGNLAEVLVTAASVIVGLPMPLIPLQILLMNLLTDALPAMVLATDARPAQDTERHQDVVDKPLYRTVITRGVVLGLGALSVFALSLGAGLPLPTAQTMTFATLVAGQLVQTVSWRHMGTQQRTRSLAQDRSLLAAMGVSWLALAAAIYVPALQRVFITAPLALTHWATVLAVAGSVSAISSTLLRLQKPSSSDEGFSSCAACRNVQQNGSWELPRTLSSSHAHTLTKYESSASTGRTALRRPSSSPYARPPRIRPAES